MTTRVRHTATPLYPGIFMAENGWSRDIADASPATALAAFADDRKWFCLNVATMTEKKWTDGEGGETWIREGEPRIYRLYVGESFTADQIEAWSDPDQYGTLLSNMRGNHWGRVVRTRVGNFQPLDDDDVVYLTA